MLHTGQRTDESKDIPLCFNVLHLIVLNHRYFGHNFYGNNFICFPLSGYAHLIHLKMPNLLQRIHENTYLTKCPSPNNPDFFEVVHRVPLLFAIS